MARAIAAGFGLGALPVIAVDVFPQVQPTSALATTTVRGVEWTVVNVHPAPPQMGSRQWAGDAQRVLDLVRSHLSEKLVVVDDFNAIEGHLTVRRFADAGLRNAMWGRRSTGALVVVFGAL